MIVTNKFVHYHLPRTGGGAFTELCHTYLAEEIQYEEKTFSWLVPKEFDNGLFDVISFRRLPSWLMSYNLNELMSEKYDPEDFKKLKTIRDNTKAGKMTFAGKWFYVDEIYAEKLKCIVLSNTIAIRQESLVQDFDRMLVSLYGRDTEGYELPHKVNKLKYPKFMLSQKDIENIYNNNPVWTTLESKIYD